MEPNFLHTMIFYGSKIPPYFTSPVLTSTVQITCLAGVILGIYIHDKTDKIANKLAYEEYTNHPYRIVRFVQRLFTERKIVRVVGRIFLRNPLIMLCFLCPLGGVTAANTVYIRPSELNLCKTAAIFAMAFSITNFEFVWGDLLDHLETSVHREILL